MLQAFKSQLQIWLETVLMDTLPNMVPVLQLAHVAQHQGEHPFPH
jgi:hypothetical protein